MHQPSWLLIGAESYQSSASVTKHTKSQVSQRRPSAHGWVQCRTQRDFCHREREHHFLQAVEKDSFADRFPDSSRGWKGACKASLPHIKRATAEGCEEGTSPISQRWSHPARVNAELDCRPRDACTTPAHRRRKEDADAIFCEGWEGKSLLPTFAWNLGGYILRLSPSPRLLGTGRVAEPLSFRWGCGFQRGRGDVLICIYLFM